MEQSPAAGSASIGTGFGLVLCGVRAFYRFYSYGFGYS
jgi:hypothetical protein